MTDGDDGDHPSRVVDLVDDSEVTSPGAVLAREIEANSTYAYCLTAPKKLVAQLDR